MFFFSVIGAIQMRYDDDNDLMLCFCSQKAIFVVISY